MSMTATLNLQVPPHWRTTYEQHCQRGRQRARASRAALCALIRDQGPRLDEELARLEQLAGQFGDHVICVYENDSQDDTPPRLQAWAAADLAHRRVQCEVLGLPKWGSVRSPVRGAQLADYRNRCARLIPPEPAPAYVLVVDPDVQHVDLDGLDNSLGWDDWDMMGSNGIELHPRRRGNQYDAWAWRDYGHPEPHTAPEINSRRYQPGTPPVPVFSCFGGVGLYQWPAYRDTSYVCDGDIDHAGRHQMMRDRGYGRIYMNPSQVVLY